MKKTFLALVSLLMVLGLFACQLTPPKPNAELTLKENQVTLYEEDTYTIEATLKNSTDKILYEIVSGETLITLEENVITAVKEGEALIKVSVEGNQNLEQTLEVTILPKDITVDPDVKLTLKEDKVSLYEEDTYTIEATLENADAKILCEVIEGETCITLNDNVITAIKEGTALVKVSPEGYEDLEQILEVTILHKEIIPNLVVKNQQITLTNKVVRSSINASITNTTGKIIYEIIEGSNLITLNNNIVTLKGNESGKALVKVSVENYPDIFVNVTINIEINNDVEDKTSPNLVIDPSMETIKLNWNKEVTTDFLMIGVSAIDDVDGDITDDVKVTHEINNKKYGTYTVTYTSTDASGNTSTAERTVEVIWDYAVEFIGHQGSYYGAPNSEEAFLYAATVLQYQALETDVRQTKDGVFVCCHDDTFGGLTIANVTWDELKDIEITSSRTAGYPSEYGEMPGTGKYTAKICTLERYLEICKEYNIKAVVELKGSPGISNSDQSRMPQLMALIEKVGMLDQTIFLASAYNCLIWVKQNGYDYIPCQYLVDSFASETVFERCKTYGLDVSGCVTYGNGQTQNTPEWVARYQDAGIKVSTYTFTQYSDYKDVQKWIDIGVDFVTVDWHSMHKLNLPDNSDIKYHTVKFYDKDNNLLKETKVRDGRAAASPIAPEVEGYEFIGWSSCIENVTAEYELVNYKITYDSNLYVLTKSTWATKEDFVNDFYNDLFDWVVINKDNLSCITYSNGVYTIKVNSTTEGSATFTSAQDIKNLGVYYFERTFGTLIYKPIDGTNSEDYVPEVDNKYFLNSEPYRTKYIECNKYFLTAMKTSYTGYSYTYQQASNNRVQIFFRFHQWCNGTNIAAFNAYPSKYTVKYLVGITATMPTDHLTYTIEDEFVLSNPISSIGFLGWYLDHDGTSEQVTSIKKGTTGDIILYAKWEPVEIPDVYSNINYELNGGENNPSNPTTYLEGLSTMLYPASKAGYKFLGWSKVEGSNSYITSISELTTGEITLYANYEYEVYSITYDLQGGDWGNQAEFFGSATTSISTSAKGDFWAGGYANAIYLDPVASHPKAVWSFRVGIAYSDVLGIYVVTAVSDQGKDFDDSKAQYVITISGSYANYSSTSSFRSSVQVGQGVKVTGDLESGITTLEFYAEENIKSAVIENYIDEYTIVTLPALLPMPKYEGKTFKGWSINQDLSGELLTELPEGLMGNITLYAVFE